MKAESRTAIVLDLEDGRRLIIQGGAEQSMAATLASGEIPDVGDILRTVPGRDGRKAILRVAEVKGSTVLFDILGSDNAESVDRQRAGMGPDNAGE